MDNHKKIPQQYQLQLVYIFLAAILGSHYSFRSIEVTKKADMNLCSVACWTNNSCGCSVGTRDNHVLFV